MESTQLSLVFGDQVLTGLSNRKAIEAEIDKLYQENNVLLQQARNAFRVDLTLADIIVASATGVLCGAVSGCFKSFVPQRTPVADATIISANVRSTRKAFRAC